jgi:predicted nuclease of predicted toxin-antitoxin system
MRLYLDDNFASPLLATLLRNAGHDVQMPADSGLAGFDDAEHLRFAIVADRVCLTQDHEDFKSLHKLVLASGGHHPGILVVHRENNPKRDMTPSGIVRAIRKLMAAGLPVVDDYIVLNQWR